MSVGATHLANGELTFSFVARHSGADSALTLGTGGACVTVSAGSVTFDEMPMAAMPSIDATYPDDFSGSITVAAFMPGTYTLKWGCNNAALYDVEAISLGTLQGTSLGQPHIDQNYGSWVWFVTEVDYTAAKTTVRLTTISENGMFKLGDNTWYLASERQIGNGGVTATAKSVVSRIIGQENQTFGRQVRSSNLLLRSIPELVASTFTTTTHTVRKTKGKRITCRKYHPSPAPSLCPHLRDPHGSFERRIGVCTRVDSD